MPTSTTHSHDPTSNEHPSRSTGFDSPNPTADTTESRSTPSQPIMSLDRDLRKMRLDKYTPAAANEARAWIEGILGERLAPGDLLAALKDGVALCK